MIRITQEKIDKLLQESKHSEILKLYSGYIEKYKLILRGFPPDSSEDTRLFIDSDVSQFDIESLLRIYDRIEHITSLDNILTEFLKESIAQSNKAWQINIKFRSRVFKWMKELSTINLDEDDYDEENL